MYLMTDSKVRGPKSTHFNHGKKTVSIAYYDRCYETEDGVAHPISDLRCWDDSNIEDPDVTWRIFETSENIDVTPENLIKAFKWLDRSRNDDPWNK